MPLRQAVRVDSVEDADLPLHSVSMSEASGCRFRRKKVSKMGSSPQKRVFLVSNTVFEGTQGKPSSEFFL